MPSKKKSKARKGAKKSEEKQGAPDTQMERLKIDENFQATDEDALLEEAIKLAAVEKEALEAAAAEQEETRKRLVKKNNSDGCDHGYVKTEDNCIIEDVAITFLSVLVAGNTAEYHLAAAGKATAEKYPEVWEDPSKLKLVVPFFIAKGTQEFVEGNIHGARPFASLAHYFEEYIAVFFHKRKATMDVPKIMELMRGDEHTIVKYLRQHIPCNCLDDKYKEVKSITKMGLCCNPQCHVTNQMVERSKMLYCTRCRQVNYCSPECQKAAWPRHKELCDAHVMARAELDSRN